MTLPKGLTGEDSEFLETVLDQFLNHVERRGMTYRVAMLMLSVLFTAVVATAWLPTTKRRDTT